MRRIEQTPSGAYKVRFRHGISPRTGKPMQTSETFDTKREAEQFARWLDALGPQGALDQLYEAEQDSRVPTLDEVAADHIRLRPNTTDGTRLNYERLWARTWGPLVGHIAAHRLTEDDLARAVMKLGKTYSRKSLENQRGLLAGVVGRAVRKGYLSENIARGLPLPAGKHADRAEMRILTPTEFDEVIEKIPDHYQPFVRFLYGTGCRWGEAVALQVQDIGPVYLNGGEPFRNVYIRRALKWSPDNRRVVGTTKTKKSKRTVVVGDVMIDDLAAACAGKDGDELVFTAHRGGPILHRTFWSRYWLPAVEHLKPRPRIHDLRHSHASVLLGGGIPPHVVQARLGHESIKTTVDTYSSLLPDAQQMAARAALVVFHPPKALP